MSDDTYKRRRFDDRDSSSEYDSTEVADRHPKRQAVPNPETNAPHFADRKSDGAPGDDTADDSQGSPQTKTSETSLRAFVNTKEAGIIIGRAGKNVSDIRQFSAARVTISDIVPGDYERILTVSGTVDAIAKAYSMIVGKIAMEQPEGEKDVTLRLLVRDNRMGNIIGKGGSIIKAIQEETGARLKASEDRIPPSFDRLLTVTGQATTIEAAVRKVAEILADGHDERPGSGGSYHNNSHRASSRGLTMPNLSGSRNRASSAYYPSWQMNAAYWGGYGAMIPMPMMGDPYYGTYPGRRADMDSSSQAQQILIRNDMVGCIIGKGGSKINEIRQMSGSHIKIADPQGDSNERLITITGTPECNQIACNLLYQRIQQEKMRLGMH